MIKTISGLLIFTFIFELRSILVLVNIDASQAEGTEFEPKFLFFTSFSVPILLVVRSRTYCGRHNATCYTHVAKPQYVIHTPGIYVNMH